MQLIDASNLEQTRESDGYARQIIFLISFIFSLQIRNAVE